MPLSSAESHSTHTDRCFVHAVLLSALPHNVACLWCHLAAHAELQLPFVKQGSAVCWTNLLLDLCTALC